MKQFGNWRIVSFVLLIAGCSLTPEYRRPESITPSQWKNESHPALTSSPSLVSKDWWKKFGSSELDRLMTESLNNNLDLAAAKERVGQFRALANPNIS